MTKKSQEDLKEIMDKIEELQKEIERVDVHTKKKIIVKPAASAATSAAATMEEPKTDAPAAPAAIPAATASAATPRPSIRYGA